MTNGLDPYRNTQVNGITYADMQAIFDAMYNLGLVCSRESMMLYMSECEKFSGVSEDVIRVAVESFFRDTHNG